MDEDNNLLLFNNNTVINYFQNRDQFIKEIEKLQRATKRLQRIKEVRDEEETRRIAIQYDHHNYQEKFKADFDIVLGALMGASAAERAVQNHGFRKKIKRFSQ